ncbi:hypothetical protein SDC9_190417 [bioreactor metagenome]|uniref:Uncharacterized protein n=1 Tax=bioreactor metagenome TaxID=1076179 RepID=A0A645HXE0_9ZZZZ
MSINVINLFRFYPSIIYSSLHTSSRHFATRIRRCNMISVRCHTIAANLCINVCSACFCMFQFFENYNAGAFTHDKTFTFFIKWARSLFRMFIISGKSLHISKTSYSNRRNSSFSTAGNHNICVTILNGAESITYTVRASSTRRYNCRIWTLKT